MRDILVFVLVGCSARLLALCSSQMMCNPCHDCASAVQVDQLSARSMSFAVASEASGASLFAPGEMAQVSDFSIL